MYSSSLTSSNVTEILLGYLLFNIFLNDLGEGVYGLFIEFTDVAKLYGIAKTGIIFKPIVRSWRNGADSNGIKFCIKSYI